MCIAKKHEPDGNRQGMLLSVVRALDEEDLQIMGEASEEAIVVELRARVAGVSLVFVCPGGVHACKAWRCEGGVQAWQQCRLTALALLSASIAPSRVDIVGSAPLLTASPWSCCCCCRCR